MDPDAAAEITVTYRTGPAGSSNARRIAVPRAAAATRPAPPSTAKDPRASSTQTAGPDAIVVRDLVKTYKNGTKAVRGISFRVRVGEIFGILGPNGAGKSTAIGILGTLVKKTTGTTEVLGIDVDKHPQQVRGRIGFAMQEAGVDGMATGREFLVLQGQLYGLPTAEAKVRAADLLKLFELEEAADKRIASYSGGMKRRIDLAGALIHRPPLLFLDEPTEGLDPRSRLVLWDSLRRLVQNQGTTVLLSTHYMEEADQLCDRLAIIDQGTIVVEGTPDELKSKLGGQQVVLAFPPGRNGSNLAQAEQVLEGESAVRQVQRLGQALHVTVDDATSATPHILRRLDRRRIPPASVEIKQPTLDDVYLRYTGRTIAAAEAQGGKK